MSFQGKLYVVQEAILNGAIEVFQIDPPVKNVVDSGCELQLQPPKLIATLPYGNVMMPIYLVECDSEILLIGHKGFYMSQIVVFKLTDLVLQRCLPTTSIGGNTVFISERSLSVTSKVLPNPVGDNVVCLEPAELNLVQYHLTSGTWSPATDICSLYGPAPGPCSIIHLIYSCCIRNRWYLPFLSTPFSLISISLG